MKNVFQLYIYKNTNWQLFCKKLNKINNTNNKSNFI